MFFEKVYIFFFLYFEYFERLVFLYWYFWVIKWRKERVEEVVDLVIFYNGYLWSWMVVLYYNFFEYYMCFCVFRSLGRE